MKITLNAWYFFTKRLSFHYNLPKLSLSNYYQIHKLYKFFCSKYICKHIIRVLIISPQAVG